MEREVAVSRKQLFDEAKQHNLSLSDDQLQRWSNDNLIAKSRPIPGSNEHGYSVDQAERIIRVATIASKIPSMRPKATEIAFRLALEGYDAPPGLILQHLEDALEAFRSRTLRVFTNRGARWSGRADFLDVVSTLIANYISSKRPRFANRGGLAYQLTRCAVRIVLGEVFRPSTGTPRSLHWLISTLFPRAAPGTADSLWGMLRDGFALLRMDSSSVLVKAVRALAPDPAPVLQASSDVGLVLAIAGSVIPWLSDATPVNTFGLCDEDDCTFINRYLPPLLTATLLSLRSDVQTHTRLSAMRLGDTTEMREGFQLLRRIGSDLVGRVGGISEVLSYEAQATST